ncbi:hypothetical protein H6P81_009968 [Aristolochia fimbriata]|uniref:Retrotransposon gag domain-containing protein n=1 Tax=Aristolochia fimbriata TaxID=158543 RepID=A0AAV7ERW0_ARIFI|nr:hypothetical protein H6P81_009968 [Aristolochia fimbriata]
MASEHDELNPRGNTSGTAGENIEINPRGNTSGTARNNTEIGANNLIRARTMQDYVMPNPNGAAPSIGDTETLYEAWERFKEMLKKCPHHQFPLWMQVQTFYNGVTTQARSIMDAVAGGTMNRKTPEEAYDLIEEMTANMYLYPVERTTVRRAVGIHNVDQVTAIQSQVEALQRRMESLQIHKPAMVASLCDFCGEGHPNHECQNRCLR